jgi:hypothetical protein
MSSDDTISPEFYAPWPDLGVKFNKQLGEIRSSTSALAPVARGIGLDASGDFSSLDGVAANSIQAYEIGEQDFHNKFRTHYNKDTDVFEIAYNTGTTLVPNWYTTWWIDNDGHVTQQNTPTTVSNVGGGLGWFKQKVGVDLEFKSITATAPITLTEGASSIDVDGSALVSTYSSDQAAAPSGDANVGVEIILSDTGKVGNDLPFKAIKAGPNVVVTNTGTAIQIESTSQVVEFYGISVGHDDGSINYPEVHNFLVNRQQFYITQQKSNPSAKTTILNATETFDDDLFVHVVGDEMTGPLAQADGSAASPSFTFTDDTSMGFSRNAADDLGVSIAGALHSRFLSDRLLTQQLQVINSGDATAPDVYWFPDSDTGLFQNVADDDSIAFATGGVRAGYFDASQDLYVTNSVIAGDGLVGTPGHSFVGKPDMGIWRNGDVLGIAVDGANYVSVGNLFLSVGVPILADAGSAAAPSLTFSGVTDTGVYKSTTLAGDSTEEVGISAGGNQRLLIGNAQITPYTFIRSTVDGDAARPMYSWNSETGIGLFRRGTSELGFATGPGQGGGVEAGYIDSSQKWWFTNDLDVSSGDVAVQDEAYGAAWDGVLEVPTKNAVYDKIESINTFENLTITDTLSAGRVEAGIGNFYTQVNTDQVVLTRDGTNLLPALTWANDLNTGMFRSAEGTIRFTCNTAQPMQLAQTLVRTFLPLNIADGSAADPTLTFTNDKNTGLYQDGIVDGIQFATGGVRAGYFDSDQNLHVENDVSAGRVEAGIGSFYTALTTADEAYDSADWNFSLGVPTKNAVRDKIELVAAHASTTGLSHSFIDQDVTSGGTPTFIGIFLSGAITQTLTLRNTSVGLGAGTMGRDNVCVGYFAARDMDVGGLRNIIIGKDAGLLLTTSDDNVFIGYKAGASATSGSAANVCVGNNAGTAITTSNHNVLLGHDAGKAITTNASTGCVFIGRDAGAAVTAGNEHVFVGYQAGKSMTTGDNATFVGYLAGTACTEGFRNTFVGSHAGQATTTGDDNTCIGFEAGKAINSGIRNTIIGSRAAQGITSAQTCVIIGEDACLNVTADISSSVIIGCEAAQSVTNTSNTIIGRSALKVATSSANNVMVGYQTGMALTTGDNNTFVGYNAGVASTGHTNTLIGKSAGAALTTAIQNTLVGVGAGGALTTGDGRNSCLGVNAGKGLEGNSNSCFGYVTAFAAGNTGNNGVYFGYQAGTNNTTGSDNLYFGYNSGSENTTGIENVYIGVQAGWKNVDGDRNLCIGKNAGGTFTNDDDNMLIGYNVGLLLTTSDNMMIGNYAGDANVTGTANVFIGLRAGSANTGSGNLYFGHLAGQYQVAVSDKLIIDNQDRTNAAGELTDSLIVGDFNATPASQSLQFNANTTITHSLMGTPDEITATVGGVAASLTTLNTEVTTDGDGAAHDDNVTLANGTSGQIKHIYCVVLPAGDTWKITPATMLGGTDITFTGVGQGCTLVYANNEGWTVVGMHPSGSIA